MQFRWVAGITLWTFFSGPAMGPPPALSPPAAARTATAAAERDRTPANYPAVRQDGKTAHPSSRITRGVVQERTGLVGCQ